MDAETDVFTASEVSPWRLSTVDYHRMAEAGILDEDDRVELIEGLLVEMSPVGPRHAIVVDALNRFFTISLDGRATVRVQNPVVVNRITEPNPDLALVRPAWHGRPFRHPEPPDIFLLVEVSESSLGRDMRMKRDVYARAGIPEYWVVDLVRNAIHVLRAPVDGAYTQIGLVEMSGTVDVAAFAGVRLEVSSLFV